MESRRTDIRFSFTIFFFVSLFLTFSANTTSAAIKPSAYGRYCHEDSSSIFTGIAHDDNGSPRINMVVDPGFIDSVLRKERHIESEIPVAPVYDLKVDIIPTVNEYCLPEYDPDTGEQIIPDLPWPEALLYRAFLVIGDSTKTGEIISGSGNYLSRLKTINDDGTWSYEWKIKAWPDGIGENMKDLVDAIVSGKQVSIIVPVPTKDNPDNEEVMPVGFSLCAPIWGSGQNKIIGLYSSDALTPDKAVSYFDNIRSAGFASIQPYAKYQSYFSYFVDLKPRQAFGSDTGSFFKQISQETKNQNARFPTAEIQDKVMSKIVTGSSCGTGGIRLLATHFNNSGSVGGISMIGGHSSYPEIGAMIDVSGSELTGGERHSRLYMNSRMHLPTSMTNMYILDIMKACP